MARSDSATTLRCSSDCPTARLNDSESHSTATAKRCVMIVGGFSQSTEGNNLEIASYSNSVNMGMVYVRGLTFTFLLLLYANVRFFIHLISMILGFGERRAEGPTLLGHGPESHSTDPVSPDLAPQT